MGFERRWNREEHCVPQVQNLHESLSRRALQIGTAAGSGGKGAHGMQNGAPFFSRAILDLPSRVRRFLAAPMHFPGVPEEILAAIRDFPGRPRNFWPPFGICRMAAKKSWPPFGIS